MNVAAGERLTVTVIRDAAREQARTATAVLPDAMFAERDGAWQVTVVGHLKAALAAVPAERVDTEFVRALSEAPARAERA